MNRQDALTNHGLVRKHMVHEVGHGQVLHIPNQGAGAVVARRGHDLVQLIIHQHIIHVLTEPSLVRVSIPSIAHMGYVVNSGLDSDVHDSEVVFIECEAEFLPGEASVRPRVHHALRIVHVSIDTVTCYICRVYRIRYVHNVQTAIAAGCTDNVQVTSLLVNHHIV
jgi:hypothetical protein